MALPTGTVTFLLTDVVGSTRLWEERPDEARAALTAHDALIDRLAAEHGGAVVRPRGEGDSRFVVFARASDAVQAATAIQQALCRETPLLRVRMALHTGEADLRDGDYYGSSVNRCARLRSLAHGGQVLISQATRDLIGGADGLKDLGEHRLRDLVQPERVYQLGHAEFPPLQSIGMTPTNLPPQLTSFVGREREIAEVKALVERTRLVTLTGTGGCGKTRLALQVAAELGDGFADGVWFVDLAPVADEAHVARSVLSALGVVEQPDQPPAATLVDRLRHAAALIVLDNCEHLVGACARLAQQIAGTCAGVRVLATSRELLGVPGEAAWRVPSLAVPDPRQLPTATEVERFEAVRLFVERARLVHPAFRVTDDNATALAEVCARLDGIPLAVELAAARVRVLTVEQIAERLGDRFRLLTGGSRTALRRQQTLQALVDWSHDLLNERERILFRRLAVFAGGWTLEAVEEVCAEPTVEPRLGASGIEPFEVLDLLTSLVDKSLVVAEAADGRERYRLLETIRQYAEEKLLQSGEAARVRDRHRDHFAALAARAAPDLLRREGPAWLARLEAEHDNLRAALDWCRGSPDGHERALALAADLTFFWAFEGHYAEGVERLEEAVACAPAPSRARVRALLGADHMVRTWAADMARSRGYADEALALARELEEPSLVVDALSRVGLNQAQVGQYGEARVNLEESIALAERLGDPLPLLWRVRDLGLVCIADGDLTRARRALDRSAALSREIGTTSGLAMALGRLALVDRLEGDVAAARRRLEESKRLMDESRHATGLWMARAGLSHVLRSEGRLDDARAALREQLLEARREGNRAKLMSGVVGLGVLAAQAGDHALAVRLIAAHTSANGVVGSIHAPDLRIEAERALACAREVLGHAYKGLFATGQASTLEATLALALDEEAPAG